MARGRILWADAYCAFQVVSGTLPTSLWSVDLLDIIQMLLLSILQLWHVAIIFIIVVVPFNVDSVIPIAMPHWIAIWVVMHVTWAKRNPYVCCCKRKIFNGII